MNREDRVDRLKFYVISRVANAKSTHAPRHKDTSGAKCGQLSMWAKKLLTMSSFRIVV